MTATIDCILSLCTFFSLFTPQFPADEDNSDSQFVDSLGRHYSDYSVVAYYNFPAANQRCGVWYINPKLVCYALLTARINVQKENYRPDIYAYFKSTDGHTNAWSFSLRRPNLHLIEHILECKGLIIVDSTRRGKRFPDALSKTIPIWCAVVSSAVLGIPAEDLLYTPPNAISESEKQAIKDGLPTWREWLVNSALQLNKKLDKPLRPIFIHPETQFLPDFSTSTLDFYPILCVSASRYIPDQIERRSWGEYVQGSGDDHELWAKGLTPEAFWENQDELLSCSSEMLNECIVEIMSERQTHSTKDVGSANRTFLKGAIYPSSSEAGVPEDDAFVALTPNPPSRSKNTMHITLPKSSKQAQKEFLAKLPSIVDFIERELNKGGHVAICDANGGTDLASVVCVAIATLFFDENGEKISRNTNITKTAINMRLQWLINVYPSSNPSRVSLKRLNDYLM
ncbi:initiator tRNA phosphoribosyl transferase [Wallemia mellicola]|nr:initiator tRNA phosphoribosyl transferase [Wallemia mellicola]TIB89412.1 initiator tRNA phosphoribosyl transferase [Wallemia mellicola]TIC36014.1 initiator tRNA phosphoribosyl transferase [Wallemia mellicola]TIC41363.1 initiator tRNA phosphoribosyl transferase [Wallemia mellicola]TIC49989.1 initiator tRNA phosphoribosyl transferase [Wallemia mellicola]